MRKRMAAILAVGLAVTPMGLPAADALTESAEELRQRIGNGNPAAGKIKSETELCQGCHGDDGIAVGVGVPNLGGQFGGYIAKQLRDFRSQQRRHRIMNAMADGLAETDIDDIAAFFASQPRPGLSPVTGEPKAKDLFLYGDVDRNLDACVSCHELGGKGRLVRGVVYPRIGGQNRGYLRVQLLNWKIGARANSPQDVMNKVAGALTEQEIAALAEYISGL